MSDAQFRQIPRITTSPSLADRCVPYFILSQRARVLPRIETQTGIHIVWLSNPVVQRSNRRLAAVSVRVSIRACGLHWRHRRHLERTRAECSNRRVLSLLQPCMHCTKILSCFRGLCEQCCHRRPHRVRQLLVRRGAWSGVELHPAHPHPAVCRHIGCRR